VGGHLLTPDRVVFLEEASTSLRFTPLRARARREQRVIGSIRRGHWTPVTLPATLIAEGFDASSGPVEFLLDGQPVDVSDQKIGPEGTVAATLSVAADVAHGEHHIEVLQGSGRAPRRTKAIFIVAEFDEHLHEGATSRLVDQPLEPEGANALEDDGA
jgi:hypothetical protein